MRVRFSIVCVLLLVSLAAAAATPDMPRYKWENFTIANGLPDDHIFCVLVDGKRIWAGTENGIGVYEVRPGIIATDMTSGVKGKYDKLIAEGIFPQRRWGQPADVAGVVGAFGRGDLDYSTGVAIDVSGGFQLKRL